eukprot:1086732-Amorphochlora_amoeboformis.AAC.2
MEGVSKDWPGKLTPLPRVLLTRNFSAPDGHGQSKDRRVEQRSGGDIMGFKLLRTKSYGSAFNALSGAVKGAGKGFEGEQDGKSRSHRRKTSFPSALYRWKPTDSATKHSTRYQCTVPHRHLSRALQSRSLFCGDNSCHYRPSVVSVSGRSHRHRPQRQVSQGVPPSSLPAHPLYHPPANPITLPGTRPPNFRVGQWDTRHSRSRSMSHEGKRRKINKWGGMGGIGGLGEVSGERGVPRGIYRQ